MTVSAPRRRRRPDPLATLIPEGRRIEAEGRSVFVRTAGDGPPILLLHGLAATGALNWAHCFRPLARRGLVIAPDHRGHGQGARVGNRFRLADCADDAAALLRTMDAGPAIVVGYSMGGPIAQLLTQRHPDLVRGLVLCATSRDFRGAPADRLRFGALAVTSSLWRLGPPSMYPAALRLPGRTPSIAAWAAAELRGHEPSALVAAASALGRFTSRSWVGTLDVPTSVLVHERDRLVPPHRQRKLAAAIPGARVVSAPVDHLGVIRDPSVYVPALLGACASVAHRAGSLQAAVA